jgi:hypothetical protein
MNRTHTFVTVGMVVAGIVACAIPAQAQGFDVQIGRDRDRDRDRRNDSDVTVGIGSGGVTIGPRQRQSCRTVTTTVERDDGRMITRRERRCD